MADEETTSTEDELTEELESLAEDGPAAGDGEEVPASGPSLAEPEPEPDPIRSQVDNLNVALKRERSASRALQEKYATFEHKMQDRMQRILGVMEKAFAKPPPKPPVFEEDPEGAVRHIVDETVGKHVGSLAEQQEQRERQAAAEREGQETGQAISAFVQQDRERFLQEQDMSEEDMRGAEKHYFEARKEQFRAWNPDLSDEQIEAHMRNEVAEFWVEHFRSGTPIAETVLGMAKASGWQGAPGGSTSKAAPGWPLEAAAKRIGKVVPVGNTQPPAPPPSDRIDMKSAIEMADADFDKWEQEMIAKGVNREDLHEDLLKEVAEFL
jgi:hypothetical protein